MFMIIFSREHVPLSMPRAREGLNIQSGLTSMPVQGILISKY